MKNISYKDYVMEAPQKKEGIEWSYNYAYNANDQESPRVLLLGDSICNGYQPHVRKLLERRVNVSYWISSFCVTRERYLRMLEMVLDENRYDVVFFNSGHCINPTPIWEKSFRSAVSFIMDKLDGVKLALVNSVPCRIDACNEACVERNAIVSQTAKELGLPLVDMWTAVEKLGAGDDVFTDKFHFTDSVKQMQAKIISDAVCDVLGITEDGNVVQVGNVHGPSGAIK